MVRTKECTLVFCLTETHALFGEGLRGISKGWWNGYGGKLEDDESPEAAACRELEEESCLVAREKDLVPAGVATFHWPEELDGAPGLGAKATTVIVHCYVCRTFSGDQRDTASMLARSAPLDSIPYEKMRPTDRDWMERMITGRYVLADVYLDADGNARKPSEIRIAERTA